MTEMLTGTACSDVTGRLYERIYQMAEPSCSLISEF